jgi:hypothetical protein
MLNELAAQYSAYSRRHARTMALAAMCRRAALRRGDFLKIRAIFAAGELCLQRNEN